MPSLTRTTDYSDRDFDSVKLRLGQLIQSVFPDWTDYVQTNFGIIMLDSFAFNLDVLNYYLDAQARETHWSTATRRRSLLNLAKLINYSPTGPKAATVDETITLAAVPVGNVTFPAGTTIQTDDLEALVYQLLAPVTILAGTDPPVVVTSFEHSATQSDTFASNGKGNQVLPLSVGPFLAGTLTVTASNGPYTVVRSLLGSKAIDRHCEVRVDHNELGRVIFGNGVNGTIPTGNIAMTYRTGGGIRGNTGPARITTINSSFTDSLSNPVSVSVINLEKAVGGANRLTNEQMRQLGPEGMRVMTRTVSREDFEINARRVSGVARALMLSSDEDADIPENSGFLYAVPVGGGQPSNVVRTDILSMVTVEYPSLVTFEILVAGVGAPIPPGLVPYKTVNVQASVTLRPTIPSVLIVKQRIEEALVAYFAIQNADGTDNLNVDFGYNIKDTDGSVVAKILRSDVFNVIRDVDGVRSVELSDFMLNSVASDLELALAEFPVLGSISLFNQETGGPL